MESDAKKFDLIERAKNSFKQKSIVSAKKENNFSVVQIKLFCPQKNCGGFQICTMKESQVKNLENKSICCIHCNLDFKFISCPHSNCKGKIFLFDKLCPFGNNILCPYTKCKKDFFKIPCPGCNEIYVYLEKVEENQIKQCVNQKCMIKFSFLKCPVCLIPNIFTENLDNIENLNLKYNSLNLFNKNITCYNCRQIFIKFPCNNCVDLSICTDNNYFEGMGIECSNKKCQTKNFIFSCPECNEITFQENQINHKGNFVKCSNKKCLAIFSKINCPVCKEMYSITSEREHLEGKKIICRNQKCQQNFSFYSCFDCNNILFWENKNEPEIEQKIKNEVICNGYVRGQIVNCQNKSCFGNAKINCPFCSHCYIIDDDYAKFGYTYDCINTKCFKKFYLNFCPSCKSTKFEKGIRNYNEGLVCPNSKFSNNACLKKYDFLNCYQCGTLLFYYEEEFNKRKSLKCPIITCNARIIIYNCKICSEKIIFPEEELKGVLNFQCKNKKCSNALLFTYCNVCEYYFPEFVKTENIKQKKLENKFYCFNSNCEKNKENYINDDTKISICNKMKNHDNENINILKVIKFQNGKIINKPIFHQDNLDNFMMEILRNMNKKLESIYNHQSENFEKCNSCNQLRDLVLFAPCGDKYSCENCFKSKYEGKDCPKCKNTVVSFIKKIFE